MFDCGITKTIHEIANQVMRDEENTIVRVVQEAGYNIDKEQLQKALTDSHSFYDQGYNEGYDVGFKAAYEEMMTSLRTNYSAYVGEDIINDHKQED